MDQAAKQSLIEELEDEYAWVPVVAPVGAVAWSESEIRAFFDDGTLPSSPSTQTTHAEGAKGGDAGDACSPSSKRRPLRFLCLHGGGSNSEMMEIQLTKIKMMLGEDAEFVYANGPRAWDPANVEPMVKAMARPPYSGWLGVDNDGPEGMNFLQRLEDPSVTFTYSAVETMLEGLDRVLLKQGPFDVVCGFSQGSVVASLLAARWKQKCADTPGLTIPWRRNILFSGLPPRDTRYVTFVDFPCTLVFGKNDMFYGYGQRLRELYPSPAVFEHDEGHRFPVNTSFNEKFVEHCRAVL